MALKPRQPVPSLSHDLSVDLVVSKNHPARVEA
jgi:hypothetical protein